MYHVLDGGQITSWEVAVLGDHVLDTPWAMDTLCFTPPALCFGDVGVAMLLHASITEMLVVTSNKVVNKILTKGCVSLWTVVDRLQVSC